MRIICHQQEKEMKSRITLLTIILSFGLFSGNLIAQYVTVPAAEAMSAGEEGTFYFLPQNIVKVDVVVEETHYYKGPYSDYCSKLLGTADFISGEKVSYRILSINTSLGMIPDPSAKFYVSTRQAEEKGKVTNPSLSVCLTEDGVLAGVGYGSFELKNESKITRTIINSSEEVEFKYFAEQNFTKTYDTTVRRITIDTTVIFINDIQDTIAFLSPEQKAKRAAKKISEIRESRYNLLIGDNEVAYDYRTLALMDNRLQKLENDYLELFVGKVVKKLVEKQFYIIPEHGKTSMTVCKYSDTKGFAETSSEITLELNPVSQGKKTVTPVNNAVNQIVYRIPEYAKLQVAFNSVTYCEKYYPISQLGSYELAPLNGTKLIFNPMNGQLINLDK